MAAAGCRPQAARIDDISDVPPGLPPTDPPPPGVTGARVNMEGRVEGLIKQLQGVTDKAVCVGFGVSGPEQAAQIKAWGAEGVICGSALVRALGESGSSEAGLAKMSELARSLRAAI